MTLNANSLLCRQFYACCDQIAEARITLSCNYKVALYHSHPHIKCDYEIDTGSLDLGA